MPKATSIQRRGVAKRLKARREELGLSQRNISSPGVTYAYVSRIESGARRPSVEALVALGERLRVSALYLMTGDAHARCPVCLRNGAAPLPPQGPDA